jgi:hypothetical protein
VRPALEHIFTEAFKSEKIWITRDKSRSDQGGLMIVGLSFVSPLSPTPKLYIYLLPARTIFVLVLVCSSAQLSLSSVPLIFTSSLLFTISTSASKYRQRAFS